MSHYFLWVFLLGLLDLTPSIVSLEKIKAVDGNDIVIGTARIPISRAMKDEVMNRIMGDNLLTR